jgi:hypothetical protein
MTPPRLTELECPNCHASHWVIDSDFRGSSIWGEGVELDWGEREYACPRCGYTSVGYTVRQQSPIEFFLQPDPTRPMRAEDFEHWLSILREHFPDDNMLAHAGTTWYPGTGRGLENA